MNTEEIGGWALAYYASEWIIRVAMTIIVPFRRSPDAARGWLLLVFFLPWPALILYNLIGRPTYPAWRRQRFLKLPTVFKITNDQVALVTGGHMPELPPRLAIATKLIRNLGRLPVVEGNAVDLISDYDGMIDRLVADIDDAKSDVHLLFYIFASDATGQRIIGALKRAKQRGVACRVLIDALGSRQWAQEVISTLTEAGIAAHLMLPVSLIRRKSARADLRNHRKLAVIDERIGYVGSQNIVDPQFKPGIVNKELMVRARGPIVLELQATFIADWFLETEEILDAQRLLKSPGPAGSVIAQVLPSGPDHPGAGIEVLVVALIHAARERVVITTPYFVPSEPLLTALQTAVLRGVEVHLVVSRIADQMLVRLAQRSYYAQLIAMGVIINLYRDKLLHAKTVSIDDDISVIGSSNLDIRSFVLNSEITLVVYDHGVARTLHRVQDAYIAMSDRLTVAEWEQRPLAVRIPENFGRMLGPLL